MASEVNMNEQDAFLHPQGSQKNLKWPRNSDRCLVPMQSILCTISVPVSTSGCMC